MVYSFLSDGIVCLGKPLYLIDSYIISVGCIGLKKLAWYSDLLALSIALEVSVYPKPGNVHRYADYPDLLFEDFLAGAIATHKWLYRAVKRGYTGDYSRYTVGDIIYYGLRDSMRLTGRGNTCLGTLLLLAPLALAIGSLVRDGKETRSSTLASTATGILREHSTVDDSIMFYRAVRLASPSYIRSDDDVGEYPNVWDSDYIDRLRRANARLWDILVHSSRRDIVSSEIVGSYTRSIATSSAIDEFFRETGDWNEAVVRAYIMLLADNIDTMVLRKHGAGDAYYLKMRAMEIKELMLKSRREWVEELWKLDKELHGKRINPGSLADILASSIALYLLEKRENVFDIWRSSSNYHQETA